MFEQVNAGCELLRPTSILKTEAEYRNSLYHPICKQCKCIYYVQQNIKKLFYTLVISISFQKLYCYVKNNHNAIKDCSISFENLIVANMNAANKYWCHFETQKRVMSVVLMQRLALTRIFVARIRKNIENTFSQHRPVFRVTL